MLNFYAENFIRLMSELQTVRAVVVALKGDLKIVVDDEMRKSANEIRDLLVALELDHSRREADRFMEFLKADEFDGKEADKRYSALSTRISDELDMRRLLLLSLSESDLYEPKEPPFGQMVETKFPSLTYDILESGKCLALERSTASAFHSVRCMEGALRAVAKNLGVPDPTKGADRSWAAILNQIKSAIEARWPKPADRFAGDGKEFHEIYASLAAIQNPYRDATTHLDRKYVPEEARHIREMARGFLARVSSRMDENGEPRL